MTRTLAILSFIGVVLAADTQVDAQAQLLLGLAAWIALALALRGLPPLLRAQALVVVVVATCAEIGNYDINNKNKSKTITVLIWTYFTATSTCSNMTTKNFKIMRSLLRTQNMFIIQ